jgi:hypothetical protein
LTDAIEPQDLGSLVACTAIAIEGVIIHTHPLPGRHLYADVDQIAEIHERGVVLSVTKQELPAPEGVAVRQGIGASRAARRRGRAPPACRSSEPCHVSFSHRATSTAQ